MSKSDILKKDNVITLIDKTTNERKSGIILNTVRKGEKERIVDKNAIDHEFEKRLFINKSTLSYNELNNERFKNILNNKVTRVLVYNIDEEGAIYNFPDLNNINITLSPSRNNNYMTYNEFVKETYQNEKTEYWYKATITNNDGDSIFSIKFDDGDEIDEISPEYIRKLDEVYDTNTVNVLTSNGIKTLRNLSRGDYKNIQGQLEDNTIYTILESNDSEEIAKLKKLKEKFGKMSKKQNKKTLYNLKWYYKTNYSGSRYFPLKISNVELLSEADKYAEIDKYTELKEGDIVKYNDPSHRNHTLLAKITGIREDPLNKRNYYDRKKYIYNIKFEPFETYIEPTELQEYQEKYENIVTTIPNVKPEKLLKYKYIEKEYYDEDIETLLKSKDKINNFNNVITENTLQQLKKNTKFNLDFILAKYQPESGVKDLNKLIKPNTKHIYTISHSPKIEKRQSGLFFDMKIKDSDHKRKTIDIDIYVDLTLYQSKVINEEEWNKTPLVGKLGTILSEQIKNSYAGMLNCPSRFDKLKTIMSTKGWFINPDEIETNLIKKSFNQTKKEIQNLKKQINTMENFKNEILKEIKENQKIDQLLIVEKQIELGKKEEEIKKANRRLIELESILKQKGGRKSKRNKYKLRHKKNNKSKKINKRHHKNNKTKKKH
jgi:hypothetical protein